jgi:hypothetical protein
LVTWTLISWYLSATAIFYAAVLVSNTEKRLELIVHATMLAAIVASLAGVIGFFHLIPGLSEAFLRYDRARGTFNDPNVLGAFLVFPALIALQRVLVGRFPDTFRNAGILILFITALFLTFSRAAWGQFVTSAVLMMSLMLMTPSRRGSTGSSPLTDPVVQNYRSGFLRCDSPRRPKVV